MKHNHHHSHYSNNHFDYAAHGFASETTEPGYHQRSDGSIRGGRSLAMAEHEHTVIKIELRIALKVESRVVDWSRCDCAFEQARNK
jgi:hypothetical protein